MRSESTDERAYAKRLGCLTVLVSALVWAGAAPAQTPPPPEEVPAVSAYIELVPTSSGSRSPSIGAKGTTKLPAGVEAQLVREGGSDAELLRKVATSREYGAPPSSRGTPTTHQDPPDEESPIAAGVSVTTDGSNERVAVLGLLLLAMTLGGAGAAVYLRRRSVP